MTGGKVIPMDVRACRVCGRLRPLELLKPVPVALWECRDARGCERERFARLAEHHAQGLLELALQATTEEDAEHSLTMATTCRWLAMEAREVPKS